MYNGQISSGVYAIPNNLAIEAYPSRTVAAIRAQREEELEVIVPLEIPGDTAIVVGCNVFRIELERLIEIGDGSVQVAFVPPSEAAVVPGWRRGLSSMALVLSLMTPSRSPA